MTGTIFDIQRFSIHDGPGIRTTVFLKGCSLQCFWCHNPESIHKKLELQIFLSKCIGCGDCMKVCPNGAHTSKDGMREFHREKCNSCGLCADACFSGALVISGREMSVEAVMDDILRDKAFYDNSGGGVTLSGGEPALQKEFSRAVLKACKDQGIHTAIETAGNCGWDDLSDLLEVTDLVMMDLKQMDPEKHRWATGVSNERILESAKKITASGKPIIFRIPVIPTVNDTPEEVKSIAMFVRSLVDLRPDDPNSIVLELLQFHQLAGDKYRSLGLDYKAGDLGQITKEQMSELRKVASSCGISVKDSR
ncbi:MAG: glycyl-radical enzyme activating protein [Armatimonadota bacterium]